MNFSKWTEWQPFIFFVKFKIKWLPASWLSIAFTEKDLILYFSLPYNQVFYCTKPVLKYIYDGHSNGINIRCKTNSWMS